MFTTIHSFSANEAFLKIANKLLDKPTFQVNPRGWGTYELPNVFIEIKNPFDRFITNKHRKLSLDYLVGEWVWYHRGSGKLNEINCYSTFWNNVSDNGEDVTSCYGKMIYKQRHSKTLLSQWETLIRTLKNDMNSRRAILLICNPNHLLLETNDVPCTLSLNFFIRDNKLFLTANMRSNDLVFGFSYDVPIFTLLQEKLLLELKEFYPSLEMGSYFHFVTSMHFYGKHKKMLNEITSSPDDNTLISVPFMQKPSENQLLVENEEMIRNSFKDKLHPLTDPFCKWCQKKLEAFHEKKEMVAKV